MRGSSAARRSCRAAGARPSASASRDASFVDQHSQHFLDEQRIAAAASPMRPPCQLERPAWPSWLSISAFPLRRRAAPGGGRNPPSPIGGEARATRGGPCRGSALGRFRMKACQILEEVQEGRLAPLDVVEDNDERPGLGEGFDQASKRPQKLSSDPRRRRLARSPPRAAPRSPLAAGNRPAGRRSFASPPRRLTLADPGRLLITSATGQNVTPSP